MSAVDEIQAAIVKLSALRDASTRAPWAAQTAVPNGQHWGISGADFPTITGVARASEGRDGYGTGSRKSDCELIVTLHSTIDTQLAILNSARISIGQVGTPNTLSLALARAINGTA
ncbi:hypothetical protein E3T43_01110 [Cryobacterium sp. Hh7]|uniref:hypothetical protein n=1 Tax=Cryobacterium sp. Hh7 TaxID=1259159 RepID=UPI00106B9597|nr:hypothetical protein [Cryobacterium sp. Hh7]TFD61099.1 hypothetical protein E3T43_01110 [Cryobacterium sp. Hh7]